MINIAVDVGFKNEPAIVVEATLQQDGNQWCVLSGEDLQVGIAGFGKTPLVAVEQFKYNFRYEELR